MFDGNREEQLRSEIESHIAAETELNIARGMSPDEARTAALRRFGNVTLSVEAARSIWVPRRLDELSQDLRYTLRTLRRNPAFSLSACAVIALSVGAAVPVFSFLNRVFLHALPYQQAERLVTVGIRAPLLDYDFFFANDYFYLRQAKTPFSQLTSWTGLPECDLTEERPLSLTCAQVESSFLSTLGVKPLLGRAFTGEEDRPEAPKVALLSYGFWQSRFGGDPDVLGRSLWVDGSPTQIIGVLPRDFEFPSLAPIDLLVPQALNMAAYRPNQTGRALHVIARLKPSSSEHRAFEQLQPFFRFELASVPPAFRKDIRPALQSLREYQVGSLAAAGWLLTAAITALLLITAANIGTLLLARGFSRQREFNVRFSLGAGWGRVASQVVTESVVLNVLGGAAGCVLLCY